MREITYYEADDGTRFDNERECLIYESKTLRSGVRLYNDDLKPLEWEDGDEFIYVNVINENALETHNAIYGLLNYSNIRKKECMCTISKEIPV